MLVQLSIQHMGSARLQLVGTPDCKPPTFTNTLEPCSSLPCLPPACLQETAMLDELAEAAQSGREVHQNRWLRTRHNMLNMIWGHFALSPVSLPGRLPVKFPSPRRRAGYPHPRR